MNSKKTTLLFLMLFTFCSVQAQKAIIKFNQTEHQFGDVKEEDGYIEHRFEFENTGQAPLLIQNVKASCGCTTPAWSKEPIAPGKTGFIQARYNPKNRPGAFHKSLTVTSNADPSITRLYIKGKVIPKPKSVEEDFPVVNGSLRFKYRTFNLGTVKDQESTNKTFQFVNTSKKSISFKSNKNLPKFIEVKIQPKTVRPGDKGLLVVTYHANKRSDLGFVSDYVSLNTTDGLEPIKKIRVVANIQQDFSTLTKEDRDSAPVMSFGTKYHDFGSIKENSKVETTFKFVNKGKKDLIIKKIKASCGCTVVDVAKRVVNPNETSEIKVVFDVTGRKGSQVKSITVYSNDPANPVQVLTVKGKI